MKDELVLSKMKNDLVSKYLIEKASRLANLNQKLSFGTGGVRGQVGIGTDKMNDVTVGVIYLNIVNYIKALQQEEKGVLLFYDTRYGSSHFANLGAKIFKSEGINVEIADKALPTPALSYAVLRHNFFLGICVTASHNPYTDIGIKVYNEHGNQITDEDLNQMSPYMTSDLSYVADKLEQLENHNLVKSDVFEREYKDYLISGFKTIEKRLDLGEVDLVYSPLHGAGLDVIPSVLKKFTFINLKVVEKQMVEDGFFKTVESPNPENLDSFKLAFTKADQEKANCVLLTDPDADRLGAAEKVNGQWKIFNGNELGALFVSFLSEIEWNRNNGYILSSVVTSDLTDVIAKEENLMIKKTLTGFKYIGELMAEGIELFFGYEESGGFLIFDRVRDKDGVQAALLFSIMKAYYEAKNMTLVDKLNNIYTFYGIYFTDLYTLKEIDHVKIYNKLIENMSDYDLIKIEDYDKQQYYQDNRNFDFKDFPKTSLLKVYLSAKEWIAFRPSGTEDKFKIYIQAWGTDSLELNLSKKRIEKLLLILEVSIS